MRQLTFEETKFVSGSFGSVDDSEPKLPSGPTVSGLVVQGLQNSPLAGSWRDFQTNLSNLNLLTIAGGILAGPIGANVGWVGDQLAKHYAEKAAPIDKDITNHNVTQYQTDASHRSHGLEINSWHHPSVVGNLGSTYVP
jgi:hypothetical protein